MLTIDEPNDLFDMADFEMKRVPLDASDPFAVVVLKIPGGLIYSTYDKSCEVMSSVFVPN